MRARTLRWREGGRRAGGSESYTSSIATSVTLRKARNSLRPARPARARVGHLSPSQPAQASPHPTPSLLPPMATTTNPLDNPRLERSDDYDARLLPSRELLEGPSSRLAWAVRRRLPLARQLACRRLLGWQARAEGVARRGLPAFVTCSRTLTPVLPLLPLLSPPSPPARPSAAAARPHPIAPSPSRLDARHPPLPLNPVWSAYLQPPRTPSLPSACSPARPLARRPPAIALPCCAPLPRPTSHGNRPAPAQARRSRAGGRAQARQAHARPVRHDRGRQRPRELRRARPPVCPNDEDAPGRSPPLLCSASGWRRGR